MAARLRLTEKRGSKLFLSRSISLWWRWLAMNFQRKYRLRKSYPSLGLKSLDIFQFYLVHALFCVAVLRNRRGYPVAIECIKPPILIAQIPKAVYVHNHCSWTGIATRTSASRPLAPPAELGEL